MGVPFRLHGERGPMSGQSYAVEGSGLTIGRRAGNDVVIGDQRVSGQHARFDVRDGSLYVTDLGSSNGTQVNGAMVAGSRQLRPGDTVQIGESEFRVDGPPAGGGDATMIAGAGAMGGETVIGGAPPAGAQRDLTFGMGAAPLPPGGPTPGGPPAWGGPPAGAGGVGPPGGPPAWGSPAPPPAPGWGGPGPSMGPPAVPIVPAPPAYGGGNRRKSGPPVPLIIGGALLLLLLIGGGLGAIVIGRSKSDPTPTATTSAAATTAPTAAVAGGAPAVSPTSAAAAAPSPSMAMGTQAAAAAPTQAPTPPPAPTQAPAAPTPAPMATATPMPMPTSPPPPPAPTNPPAAQSPKPNGTVPAGWKVYNGHPKVPFVMAYPPNWKVDESDADTGSVGFSSPDGQLYFLVHTTGKRDPNANIDVLRDNYATSFVRSFKCNRSGVENTGNVTRSGINFAFLLQTCDVTGSPLKMWDVAAGLKNGVEWNYFFISTYATYSASTCKCSAGNFEAYYSPMLSTLNIYKNP